MGPSRSAFLDDLMAELSSNTAYAASWGTDSDVAIESNPVDPTWGAGSRRVEYRAVLKAVEPEATVYLWEMLTERATGHTFGSFDSQAGSGSGDGGHAPSIGAGSPSWEWGYGTLRQQVAEIAARHGFTVREVLSRRSASW